MTQETITITGREETDEGWTFTVTVGEGGDRTEHTVTVARDYWQERTEGAVPAEDLVRASFAFLLDREPKEAILPSFALPVIERYFPEYPEEIGAYPG